MPLLNRPLTDDEIRQFVAEMRKPYVPYLTFLGLMTIVQAAADRTRPDRLCTSPPVASSTLAHFESAGAFSGLPIKPSDSP